MGCSPWGRWESDMTEQLHFHFSLSCIGEGNGNPLHCSCLENCRDSGAWWAIVYGVVKSRTRLKWLSSSRSIVIFSRDLGDNISLFSEVLVIEMSVLGLSAVSSELMPFFFFFDERYQIQWGNLTGKIEVPEKKKKEKEGIWDNILKRWSLIVY